MGKKQKFDRWSLLVDAATVFGAISTGLAALLPLVDGKPISNPLNEGLFLLFLGLLIWQMKGSTRGRALRITIIGVILIFAIVISPAQPSCSAETFSPVRRNDELLAKNCRIVNDSTLGPSVYVDISLRTTPELINLGAVSKSVTAAAGDIIEFDVLPIGDTPGYIYLQTILKDGPKILASYALLGPLAPVKRRVSIRVPSSIGNDEIGMELIAFFSLRPSPVLMPVVWTGSIAVSKSVMVRTDSLPEILTPTSNYNTTEFPYLTESSQIQPTSTLSPEILFPSPTATIPSTPTAMPDISNTIVDSRPVFCTPLEIDSVSSSVDWWYVAKPGDRLDNLALFFYHDANQWISIYAANQSILGFDPALSAGQVLLIPHVASPINYEVLQGDSLQSISAAAYGWGGDARWCTIYEQNPDSIGSNPHRLKPGAFLKLFPLVALQSNQLRALPDDTMIDIALGYYHDESKLNWLCRLNGKDLVADCSLLFPLQTVTLPDLPAMTYHIVIESDTWASISEKCYGSADEGHVYSIQKANRRIVGVDPTWLRVGQELQLWGCKVINPG